jgi:hypothetical protein
VVPLGSFQSENGGANVVNQVSYTYELTKGVALNFGADEKRSKTLSNLSRPDALRVGFEPNNSYGGQELPDPYASLYLDGKWGFWRAAVLAHDVNATYYTSTGTVGPCPAGIPPGVAVTTCDHPGDRLGWVIMQGGKFKLPMLGEGDRIGYFFHYGRAPARTAAAACSRVLRSSVPSAG